MCIKGKPGVFFFTWIYLNSSMDKQLVIPSIMNCGMKLLIHPQTSMVQPLKFGNI